MNKRINQLLSQAYDEAVPETWTTLSSEQLEKIYDKFTELIVRECVREVEGLEIVVEDGHEQWNRAVAHAGLHLRDHFGVLE